MADNATHTEAPHGKSDVSIAADALIGILNTAERNRLAKIERQKNMVRGHRLVLIANAAISSI